MYSFNKNNDTITEKIKLRNKYASKIIKKFNKSIGLLSEINNHIYKKQEAGAGAGSSGESFETLPTIEQITSKLGELTDASSHFKDTIIHFSSIFKAIISHIDKTRADENKKIKDLESLLEIEKKRLTVNPTILSNLNDSIKKLSDHNILQKQMMINLKTMLDSRRDLYPNLFIESEVPVVTVPVVTVSATETAPEEADAEEETDEEAEEEE